MKLLLDVEPVRNVQTAYFELLRRFFGGPYEQMQSHNLSPATVAAEICTKTSLVEAFENERDELLSAFVEFWGAQQDLVNNYLRSAEMMKSFFGGDISPVVELDHLSATLLYTDTMVIQCPILRLIPIIEISPKEGFRLLVKHSLNIMRFEQLALADVEPPIFLVTGSAFALDEEYRTDMMKASEPYELAQAKALLGRDFAGTAELRRFVFQIKNEEEAIRSISDPSRALFDTEWNGSLADQFHRSVRELTDSARLPSEVASAGFVIHNLISGRMLQANEIVLLNSSIRATPLLSAPTSWQYLLWRYEFDAAFVDGNTSREDLVTTNAILTRGNREEVPLISGLSIAGIVALRREGAMGSLRELMRRSIQRIDLASRNDLKKVSQEVSRELGDAFDKHARDLADLKTGRNRFYGVDVLPSIATGALTLAGAATGNIPLTTLGAISTALFGSKSVPALRETWREIRAKHQEIKRSPAAMLLRITGKN